MPEIIFNGPDGRLEGRYVDSFHKENNEFANAPVALILHPHPLHGGTMNNKVVYRLYQTFARCGFSVFRFNFRGVGRSQGEYDHGVGELSDAAAALDWLQRQNQTASGCWVAGFSFGAWIALQLLMRRPEIKRFIAVAPPAVNMDFSFLSPCPASGLVVQGTQDAVVKEADVRKLSEKMRSQPIHTDYRTIEGADHFFKEKGEEFDAEIEAYVRGVLAEENLSFDGDAAGDKRRRMVMKNS
ncbi:MAG: alpha/beta hydrolase [Rickettsiales bacterium]